MATRRTFAAKKLPTAVYCQNGSGHFNVLKLEDSKLEPTGVVLTKMDPSGWSYVTPCAAASGNKVVTYLGGKVYLWKKTSDGSLEEVMNVKLEADYDPDVIHAIAISSNGFVFLSAGYNMNAIYTYKLEDDKLTFVKKQFGGDEYCSAETGVKQPFGLAECEGILYVSEAHSESNRIQAFKIGEDGTLTSIKKVKNSKFDQLKWIRIDDGFMYVAQKTDPFKIHVFGLLGDGDLHYCSSFGETGSEDGKFDYSIYDIAAFGGYLWVADNGGKENRVNVYKADEEGNLKYVTKYIPKTETGYNEYCNLLLCSKGDE